MVFIPPSEDPACLNAYLVASLGDDEIKKIKESFELGACSRFSPLLELKIVRPPSDYEGKPHQYMRAKENEAGRTGPFIVIDNDAVERDALWYVSDFADEDMVEDGVAESTEVVMKILVKTDCIPLTHVNYDIANMSIEEDLENCGVEDMPLKNDFEQPEVSDCGGLDMREQQWDQAVWVTAEPGEYEETTDEDILRTMMPKPSKMARLKDEVARGVGVVPRWTSIGKARSIEMPDGTKKEFPEGSVVLQQTYNPEFDWPAYRWPEGSL